MSASCSTTASVWLQCHPCWSHWDPDARAHREPTDTYHKLTEWTNTKISKCSNQNSSNFLVSSEHQLSLPCEAVRHIDSSGCTEDPKHQGLSKDCCIWQAICLPQWTICQEKHVINMAKFSMQIHVVRVRDWKEFLVFAALRSCILKPKSPVFPNPWCFGE